MLPNSEVHHLIRQGSDHVPLHVVCDVSQDQVIKTFRFLNFWTKHEGYNKVVKKVWCSEDEETVKNFGDLRLLDSAIL